MADMTGRISDSRSSAGTREESKNWKRKKEKEDEETVIFKKEALSFCLLATMLSIDELCHKLSEPELDSTELTAEISAFDLLVPLRCRRTESTPLACMHSKFVAKFCHQLEQ
jgi:hypothetical protein